MTDFLVALGAAVGTLSGTTGLVGGVQAVARGAVRPVAAEALAAVVHIMDPALAESAGAGHGPALQAGEAAALVQEEDSVEAVDLDLAVALEASVAAWQAEERITAVTLETDGPAAHLMLEDQEDAGVLTAS